MTKICVHTLCKNEEKYLWYAVESVVRHVDEIMIWDTGSTDKTPHIMKELKKEYPKKISLKFLGEVDPTEFTQTRNKMLDETNANWIILVDADEVWWDEKIQETIKTIRSKGGNLETIINTYTNVIGDIFHYQDPHASYYKIDDSIGPITIRAMNTKIPGLKSGKPHGQQGFFDVENNLIQTRNKNKRIHIGGVSYLHFTHLQRSSLDNRVMKRSFKYKYEIGNEFPLDYYYPESFFRPRPECVESVWQTMPREFVFRALVQTPVKKMRRKLFSQRKSGY